MKSQLSQSDNGRAEKSCFGNRKWIRPLLQVLAALLVSVAAPLSVCAHLSDSVTVFKCAFGDDWDVNYDGWPDRWVRLDGPEYPHYVNIAIQDDSEVAGD